MRIRYEVNATYLFRLLPLCIPHTHDPLRRDVTLDHSDPVC